MLFLSNKIRSFKTANFSLVTTFWTAWFVQTGFCNCVLCFEDTDCSCASLVLRNLLRARYYQYRHPTGVLKRRAVSPYDPPGPATAHLHTTPALLLSSLQPGETCQFLIKSPFPHSLRLRIFSTLSGILTSCETGHPSHTEVSRL